MEIFMLKDKKGFLLIESLLLLEIVIVLAFILSISLQLYIKEEKRVSGNNVKEEEWMRKAYEKGVYDD